MRERMIPVLTVSALLVAGLGRVLPPSPDPDDDLRTTEDRFYLLKTHADVRCDVIVLGDSRALRGIAPSVLSEELGGATVFNFAYNAGSLNAEMYREAEARLNPDPAGRRTVLLAVTPLALLSSKVANQQFAEFQATPRDEIWLKMHHPELVEYFQPLRPAAFIKEAFEGGRMPALSQTFHDDGWIESRRPRPDPEEALGVYAKRLRGQSIDETLVDDLLRQTADWTGRGIRVVAFRPPTTDAVEDLENRMTGFDEDDLARRIEEAGGTWLRFSNDGYLVYDGSHLDRESARRFSRELAVRIRPLR